MCQQFSDMLKYLRTDCFRHQFPVDISLSNRLVGIVLIPHHNKQHDFKNSVV